MASHASGASPQGPRHPGVGPAARARPSSRAKARARRSQSRAGTMLDLRVPKRRVAAEVVLSGGEARRIWLFLADAASRHAGAERPSDLLNGGADFLPALDEESGLMTFLNRGGVAVVRVDRALEADDGDALTLPTEHEVEVLLGSGLRLRGLVSFVRPPDHSRLVDFLNEPSPFFRLLEERAIALVNKRHVSRVALVSP